MAMKEGHMWLNILHCWKHPLMNYLSAFLIDNGVWELEERVGLGAQSTLSSKAGQMNHVHKVNISLHWLQQKLSLMTCRSLDGKCLKLKGINLACASVVFLLCIGGPDNIHPGLIPGRKIYACAAGKTGAKAGHTNRRGDLLSQLVIPSSISFNVISHKVRCKKVHLKSHKGQFIPS